MIGVGTNYVVIDPYQQQSRPRSAHFYQKLFLLTFTDVANKIGNIELCVKI